MIYNIIDSNKIKEILIHGIKEVSSHDKLLLRNALNERSIAHRLAIYLEYEVKKDNLNVDCEYNKITNNKDSTNKMVEVTKSSDSEKTVKYMHYIPDIIIHERESQNRNLLVIEMKFIKKYNRRKNKSENKSEKKDYEKLISYSESKSLKYCYASYIEFRKDEAYLRIYSRELKKDIFKEILSYENK